MSKHSPISFTPLGGGREIGANSYLIRTDEQQFVIDCGTHPKKDGIESLPDLSLLERAPDAVIVSHAHVDHCMGTWALMGDSPQVIAHADAAARFDRYVRLRGSVSRYMSQPLRSFPAGPDDWV